MAVLLTLTFTANPAISNTQNTELTLVGSASFTYLFWDIYDIKLFTENGKYKPNQTPISLALTYHQNISSEDLVDETGKQWSRFKITPSKKKLWLEQLQQIWPNVSESDTITFHVNTHKQTLFYFNDAFIGRIDNSEFSQAFTNIWLGTKGSYPKITEALTGKSD